VSDVSQKIILASAHAGHSDSLRKSSVILLSGDMLGDAGMHLGWLVIALNATFVVAALVLLLPSFAADDADTCAKGSSDEAIAACTREINSGHLQGRDLGKAYSVRGT
jgi:hypothetical protein